MKHIALYARVSTNHQDTQLQEHALERWAAQQEGAVQWYKDKATGRNMDRPGWQQLEEARQLGEVSAIVVWRLDRLGRTASGLTKLFDELSSEGVNLISLKDSLDLSTPAGRLMANVLASVSQYETEVRAERVKAGIERAKANGKRWGGSKKGRHTKRVNAHKRRAVTALANAGRNPYQIAKAVGLSRTWVVKLLERRLLRLQGEAAVDGELEHGG